VGGRAQACVALAAMVTLLALFSSLLWGTADFYGGKLSKKHPAIAVLAVTQAIGLIFGIFLAIVSGAFSANAFGENGYFIPGAFAGVLGYLGLICLYAGLSTGRMGVVSPISGLSALIPVAYAYFIKGDRLSIILSLGAALAIIGAFFASGPELSQGLPAKPLILALGAAGGFGTALVWMAIGSQGSALMTMVMMRATTFVVSLLIFAKYQSLGGLGVKNIPVLIFIGCADFLANLLLGVATTKGILTLAMVLGAMYPIFTAVLAYKYLNERLHRIQYWGVALAVIGIGIISAF
jgi:drug/metabolite transporter (DMT)-like permease|tara:strand:+ start:594 stop:1475 length:882 start_codon:yes stop_codon:yes gene_type:complete